MTLPATILSATAASNTSTIIPADVRGGRLAPIGAPNVRIRRDGHWGRWQDLNARVMIDHCASWMRRAGWIGNLEAAAAGTLPEARRGREFTDSDVFKLVEAMSWEQGRFPTAGRQLQILELIEIIGAAQEPDGYINTQFGRPGQAPRYSNMEWGHELYNYGHLLQAAVARLRTTGPDELLEIATKVADHICDTFGDGGLETVCGHPEIELGLIEFARATGEERYRRQAELFLERRGHQVLKDIEFGREYFQDDLPIREATVLRGHAVRALYLAAAAVDLAVDRGDTELLTAIERQWENTVRARTYITGGMGSHHQDEAFGADFELPSDRAYCETCAGVGSFMLSWRLLLATGKARYADLMERTLFNVIATAPAEDGRSFFYTNTLHQRTPGRVTPSDEQSPRAASSLRAPWFEVSCCPTNVARTLSTLDAYLATTDADGLRVQLYTSADIHAVLPDGRIITVRVETDYPRSGIVRLAVDATDGGPWTLRLRVPDWADGDVGLERGGVRVDGGELSASIDDGWLSVPDVGAKDEMIVLQLPMTPKFTFGDSRIDSARAAVAVERGPLVYCAESIDLDPAAFGAEPHVDQIIVDTTLPPSGIDGRVFAHVQIDAANAGTWPYQSAAPTTETGRAEVELVPYNTWGQRGPATMRVWLRTQ